MDLDLLYIQTHFDIEIRGNIDFQTSQRRVRLDLPKTIPAAALNQAMVSVEIEALAAVCCPRETVLCRRGMRRPDVGFDMTTLAIFAIEKNDVWEATRPGLF